MKNNLTVLVADDHLFLRESLHAMLEKNLCVKTIYEVENGRQAIEMLKLEPIHVLLLDIRMPQVYGFEVIEYVQRHGLSTRIIALTAFDEEAMIFNLLRANVAGIIFKKTTHQQEIFSAIATVLEGKQ